ncbi:MAG: hypothetical protein NT023_09305 [Armatimonadetes bacterium]|nr:hypothetical protein [Armatimonadota bacterium]
MTPESLAPLPLEKWLSTIESEYLSDYIRSGGSAVKVVTGSDAQMTEATTRLREMASAGDYYYAHLDPAKLTPEGKRPDLHRIERFFFEATKEVDWKAWAAEQARQFLQNKGILLAEGRDIGDVIGIAQDNGRDPNDLINQYQREFATPQIRDTSLSFEFRSAITALGRTCLIPEGMTPTNEEVLLGWFRGYSPPGAGSALKKLQIYERISINNARPQLASFCRWLPHTGHSGLVVTLDFRPYEHKKIAQGRLQAERLKLVQEAVERGADSEEIARLMAENSAAQPEVFYSDAAYMHALTLIRRFIDEIDWFERFLLVILTTPNFYKDKTLNPTVKRCYFDYDALQTRIGQEVHDSRYTNPAASLVNFGGTL